MSSEISSETSRKKHLEKFQRGLVIYKLMKLGWELSEHHGDGYDLVGVKSNGTTEKIVKLELKAIDLSALKDNDTFSQNISEYEIIKSTHIIISIFDDINPQKHYVASIEEVFNRVKDKKTKKFSEYANFSDYKAKVNQQVIKSTNTTKGSGKAKNNRLKIDVGHKYSKIDKWVLSGFENKWEDLSK